MERKLEIKHKQIYKETPNDYYYSPGRVNLLGEHTDYSGGYCLPITINLGIYASISLREDKDIYVYSDDFKDMGIVKVNKTSIYHKNKSYINYIKGVISILNQHGYQIDTGLNITLMSTLPKSSGLSSSAALEVLFFKILNHQDKLKLKKTDIVQLSKKVENDYIGVSSGIMDQFSIAYGKKDKAILLDTDLLTYEYIPIDLKKYTIVLMNTNKARNLVDSEYNKRFKSIEKAKDFFNQPLGKIGYKTLLSKKDLLDDLLWKRFKHVVSENERTLRAKKAIQDNNYQLFGQLMNESHQSLKDDFNVSCDELDYLVEESIKRGAIGARMTGAGFGGTMLAIYQTKSIPSFKNLESEYFNKFNFKLDIYIAAGEDGAKHLGGNKS
ncbi:MAG: galactokinase [Bacillota bacterium]